MDVVNDPDSNQDQVIIQMINQYQEMLLKMCYVYLRDEDQARDAVQETFLKAYKALPSFRGACSEKTWLLKIAMNTCRDMRRSAWFRHVDRRITPDQIPNAFSTAEDSNLEIMSEIMQLPPKLKEVIMLYYWKDMQTNEIAAVLGIAQSSVTDRLKRARNRLKTMLEERGYHG